MLKTVSSFVNVIGALNYKGTWNASTNINPTLASGIGVKGDYYVVSVAGSTTLDGESLWGVGDWAVFNGTVWQKVDGGDTGNFTTVVATSTVTASGLIPSSSTVPSNGVFLPAANTVGIATNNIERIRIDSSGNTLSGTSSTDGAASNTTLFVGGIHKTASGTKTAASSGVTEDLVTLTAAGHASYILTVACEADDPTGYQGVYLILQQGFTASRIVTVASAGSISVNMSTLTVQATQSSGISLDIKWTLVRIA